MTLITALVLILLAFLANNVKESEAGCCCCHCCKCCSCCTPCCNPPLLIKLPRTCPCCCKCCCPCCCCGGGGRRKRRDVRLLWKRAVPFPQLQLPASFGCGGVKCTSACSEPHAAQHQQVKAKKRSIVNLKDLIDSSLKKSD